MQIKNIKKVKEAEVLKIIQAIILANHCDKKDKTR